MPREPQRDDRALHVRVLRAVRTNSTLHEPAEGFVEAVIGAVRTGERELHARVLRAIEANSMLHAPGQCLVDAVSAAVRDDDRELHALRAGLERLLSNTKDVALEDAIYVLQSMRKTLRFLIDHLSPAGTSAQDIVDAVLDADVASLPKTVRKARLAYEFTPGGQ